MSSQASLLERFKRLPKWQKRLVVLLALSTLASCSSGPTSSMSESVLDAGSGFRLRLEVELDLGNQSRTCRSSQRNNSGRRHETSTSINRPESGGPQSIAIPTPNCYSPI